MDDVGQTLLNWASAFGTQEMVEFLCQNGADVNKGQRSSSLHYAACFGRPQIARVLLRFGANPDLRDEVSQFRSHKFEEKIAKLCFTQMKIHFNIMGIQKPG